VQALQDKGGGFDGADCALLLELMRELLGGLLGRYRALAADGRVELAMSPWAHPILPLLLDPRAGQESEPASPAIEPYPDGRERARWQLRHGREVFHRHLQVDPLGCWPSEGALSTATVALLADEGFRWCASGEGVLRNSLAAARAQAGETTGEDWRHRAWRIAGHPVDCFFRDDGLSDLIGFSYSGWHADDAVANLVHHMENIAAECVDHGNSVLTVILDGENAWEHYPENGWHFLRELYRRLAHHPRLALSTFASLLEHCPQPARLERLVAGSWVHGTLSTWAGSRDKNRGWELLAHARQAFERARARLDAATLAQAERALAVCEGSDWFWWFGDYNPVEAVADFESLYRAHLAGVYGLLGEPVPAELAQPFCFGGGDPELGGVMRTGSAAS
jgi:alpha-amylase/alpha-mannosidase (GH57 family)